MKSLNPIPLMLVLFLSVTLFSACNEDDEPAAAAEPLNIAETAIAAPEFSTLVSALQKANLVSAVSGTDMLTVFAPTNDAFDDFLMDNGFSSLDEVPTDVLTDVLLNHVVAGEVKSTDLTAGYVPTLAKEKTTENVINLYVDLTSGVMLNGVSKVTAADIDATNGVIHKIDKVLAMPSVVTHALSNPDFSILVQALTRSDLTTNYVEILTGSGPFTVFAPTNSAFVALLESVDGWDAPGDIPVETLEAVLTYHVIGGANVLSSTLVNNQEVGTLNGAKIKIMIDGMDASILDANDRVSNIVATDVQATNGVIHAIDQVILP